MADPANILIVDDEPKICQFLEVLLRREDYNAESVYNATDALERIEGTAYDLVITDLKMSGMDGFELVTRIKAAYPELPVIMVTGYATVETAVKALRHGVDDYVTKPFNVDDLRKVVARTLKSSTLARENRRLRRRLETAAADSPETASAPAAERAAPDRPDHRARGLAAAVSTDHDLDRLLKRTLLAVNRKLSVRYSSVMLREGENLVVRACEDHRARDLIGTRQPLTRGIAGHVARHGKPVLVKDLARDSVLRPTEGRSYRTASFICAPIVHEGKTLGVINVGEKEDGAAFGRQDLQVVLSVAERIAPAVEKTLLCRAVEERCASVIEGLVNALEAKDRYLHGHSRRVSEYACGLARAAGVREGDICVLARAAHLHDIGRIALSDLILSKPDRLDQDEVRLVRRHPATGEHMVRSLDILTACRPVIRHHHERVDGTGYPDGLRGEDIPQLARILTIADAYDAMTSARPYRPPIPQGTAAAEMEALAGLQFDAELVRLFCKRVIATFPKSAGRTKP